MSGLKSELKEYFLRNLPRVDFASLRYGHERSDGLMVRRDVLEPVESWSNRGIMVTVMADGGCGYAATADLTEEGVKASIFQAGKWAALNRSHPLADYSGFDMRHSKGEYRTEVAKPWQSMTLGDKIDLLKSVCARLKISERIVDWDAALVGVEADTFLVTSGGGEISQEFRYLIPYVDVVANRGSETVTRSLGGHAAHTRQTGLELLDAVGFMKEGDRIADEALQLLDAPNCPTGKTDLLLDPTQMMFQIHESVGHPLEIDRILGDERNYAGTSFVTPDMFGTYRYGSDLLNITFDPGVPGQLASYAFDDDGTPAKREHIIENGILKRGLGGGLSQHRSGIPGVACSRAHSWNRPPIDRMANLNLEPGESTFQEMVAAVENGIYMDANTSWSIDDSRNKFQFGCEYGRLIKNGELTQVVKKPNYRGISAIFWRNLKMVGDRSSYKILGLTNCGKGEPNQLVCTGHASPACLFSDVDVFGGE